MSKFDDMIYGLRQEIEIPADVWERYTNMLSRLPEQKTGRMSRGFSGRRTWYAAAAAVLVIGTASVSAAAYLQWSRSLKEQLQVMEEQQKALEDDHLTSYVGQSVTQGDVTVTAQQSIVDNHCALVSFKVEGYEVEDGVQPAFGSTEVQIGKEGYDPFALGGNLSSDFYDGLIPGPDGKAVHANDGTPLGEDEVVSYTMEDGSLEYQIRMFSDAEGSFIDQPIHVELKDLGVYPGEAMSPVTDTEGVWSFDWTLPGNDETKKFVLNAPLGDSGATVLEAELSPISISLSDDFPRQEIEEKGIDENGEEITCTTYKEPPLFAGVCMKDGTIYTAITGAGSLGYTGKDSDLYQEMWALNRVIDVEQVESLLFVKSYPEGEQPLAKENLYFVPVETESR